MYIYMHTYVMYYMIYYIKLRHTYCIALYILYYIILFSYVSRTICMTSCTFILDTHSNNKKYIRICVPMLF